MKTNQINSSDEVKKLRKIIGSILNLLENKVIKNKNINIKTCNKLKSLIGEKESIVSVIYKLGNLLLKIDSMFIKEDETDNIDQLDIEIIRDFFNKKDN